MAEGAVDHPTRRMISATFDPSRSASTASVIWADEWPSVSCAASRPKALRISVAAVWRSPPIGLAGARRQARGVEAGSGTFKRRNKEALGGVGGVGLRGVAGLDPEAGGRLD